MTEKKKKHTKKKSQTETPPNFSGLTGRPFIGVAYKTLDFQTHRLLSNLKFTCFSHSDCLISILKQQQKGEKRDGFIEKFYFL